MTVYAEDGEKSKVRAKRTKEAGAVVAALSSSIPDLELALELAPEPSTDDFVSDSAKLLLKKAHKEYDRARCVLDDPESKEPCDIKISRATQIEITKMCRTSACMRLE